MDMAQITGLIVTSVLYVPGIIFGIVLCSGRGVDMIAGFNTASPEERAKWDEKALCRGVGILLFLIVGCCILTTVGAILNVPVLEWVGLILCAAVTVGGLIYINKSKRFRKK